MLLFSSGPKKVLKIEIFSSSWKFLKLTGGGRFWVGENHSAWTSKIPF